MTEAFEVKFGVRQGCVLSPLLINCFIDRILREVTKTLRGGIHIEYATGDSFFPSYRDKMSASSCVQDALYTDDLTLIAETRRELQHTITALDKACDQWAMCINSEKTKILTVGEY